MKNLFLMGVLSLLLLGCSTKEFNSGVKSITSDITNAFEGSKDKSAQ
ncbi:hypothetical protein [Sulfurimonas denitrificans]|jgi:hypothetical protein|nr:hypothetical protein [Sulfurimonas denitrificans]MDD3443713.1 hypothetical protein [Sulfurimonas denitrificans]